VTLLRTDAGRLAERLAHVRAGDVLLCIGIRRYVRTIMQAAEHFRSCAADVIAITDSPLSPFCGTATHRLLVHTGSFSPFDSFTAAMSVATLIANAVAARRRGAAMKTLIKREALCQKFGDYLE
jgi:DNA-binding MurR/RpiR family transcriptional regulator